MNTLIPCTKVKLRNALLPGLVCGLLFYFIQYVFVSGQISVTKYNAVYGGFAFLPLFLIWMHLSWTVCIACAAMTYSSQNFFRFNYSNLISGASAKYMDELTLYVVAVIVSRFENGEKPYGKQEIAENKQLPIRLVSVVVNKLTDGGFLSMATNDEGDEYYLPAMNLSKLTVGQFMDKYHSIGYSDFIVEPDVAVNLERVKNLLRPDNHAGRMTMLDKVLNPKV